MAGEPIVTFVGNIVADPELRMSQAGKPWVTFRLACTPRVKDRDSGEWGDGETTWVGCKAYSDYAANIDQSLRKGTRVIVQGRLSTRTYTDNSGVERSSLDLEVEAIGPELRFATAQVQRSQGGGGGGAGQQGSAASYYGQQPQQQPQQQAPQGYAQGGPQQQPAAQQAWGQPAVPPQQQDPWTQQGAAADAAGDPWGQQF